MLMFRFSEIIKTLSSIDCDLLYFYVSRLAVYFAETMSYRRLSQMPTQLPEQKDPNDGFINLGDCGVVREIGSHAVWSLSSCKPGFGVDQLRDNSLETYWQSDGPQPHLVNIQFRRKTTLLDIGLFADYKLDESYTPSRVSIRAGNHFHDIHEIELIELNEPGGWSVVPMLDSNGKPIRAFLVQIAILSNHQNGRDTHIRQIKIHSPVNDSAITALPYGTRFRTVELAQHSCIR